MRGPWKRLSSVVCAATGNVKVLNLSKKRRELSGFSVISSAAS